MQPKIHVKKASRYAGIKKELSLTHYEIAPLWASFMKLNASYRGSNASDFFAITSYPSGYFDTYNPNTHFHKTVGIEVDEIFVCPEEMTLLTIPETHYAVIDRINSPGLLPRIIQEFLTQWLPSSPYALLDQPHIEVIDRSHYFLTNEMHEQYWFPIGLK